MRHRGSWTLIELLVACVILIALAAWLMPRYLTRTPAEKGLPARAAPIERAHGVECMNNLHQIRAAITMYRTSSETFPPSLRDLSGQGIPTSMLSCPVSHLAYGYRPDTGQVWCPYPDHQRY
jgi:type II secretory pathway pseudopilin PulG